MLTVIVKKILLVVTAFFILSCSTRITLNSVEELSVTGTEEIAPSQAIIRYTKEIEKNNEDHEAYFNRGVAYRINGELEKSILDLSRAIELAPSTSSYYTARGTAQLAAGRKEMGMNDFNRAIELDAESDIAYYCRGSAYFETGRLNLAVIDYNRAIKINPYFFVFYGSRGYAYSLLGEDELALSDYQKSIELEPDCLVFYFSRIGQHILHERYEQALSDINRAMEIDDQSFTLYLFRANLYFKLDDISSALADCNRAIELYDSDGGVMSDKYSRENPLLYMGLKPPAGLSEIYMLRAECYSSMKDYQSAMDDINRAIEMGSENSSAYETRSWLYSKIRKFDSALADIDRAVSLNPESGIIYIKRAMLLLSAGRKEEAWHDIDVSVHLGEIIEPEILEFFQKSSMPPPSYTPGPNMDLAGKTILKLSEVDTRPRVLETAPQDYPFDALIEGLEGRVMLSFIVTRKGNVINLEVVESNPSGVFDDAALSAVQKYRFSPGIKDGRPVDVFVKVPVVFTLDDMPFDVQEVRKKNVKFLRLAQEGKNYLKRGEYDGAVPAYTAILNMHSTYSPAYFGRGVAYMKKGRYDDALSDIQMAIQIDPNIGTYYNQRGMVYYLMGNYQKALSDFNRAIEIFPGLSDAYGNRGKVYEKSGKIGKSCGDFKKACELGDCDELRERQDSGVCPSPAR